MATGTAFVLEELTGQRRVVRLIGRALPYRGFGVGRRMRLNAEWNPASPEATHTISGSELLPSSLSGRWSKMWLGAVTNGESAPFTVNARAITDVQEAVRVIDSMCAEGQELRVSWGAYQLVGRIEEWTPAFDNLNDCKWDMKIEWLRASDNGPALLPFDAPVTDATNRLSARAARLAAVAAAPPQPILPDVLAGLTRGMAALNEVVSEAERLVEQVVTTSLAPAAVARRFAAVGENIIGRASALLALVTARPAAALFDVEAAGLRFGERLALGVWQRSMAAELDGLRREGVQTVQAQTSMIEGELLAVHSAREGEDLRAVSQRYYNTVDQWRALLRFNRLQSAELLAGQLVRVPYLNNLGADA